MNALIETLAKQAGMVQYPTGLGISENTLWGDRNIAMFAKLIVRECINEIAYIGKANEVFGDRTDKGGLNHILWTTETSIEKIKEHFGVEERPVPIVSANDRALFAGISSNESFSVEGAKKAFGVKR
jgi:hypothetical protein